MVCICGGSKCGCSKSCSCIPIICSCMPCKEIRKPKASPSGKIPTLNHSQQQELPVDNKSILNVISVSKGTEANGNSNSLTIPVEAQKSEVKADENPHQVQHTSPFKANRRSSSNDEQFDYRFAETVQEIILRQGRRQGTENVISRLGKEDLVRCNEYGLYASSFARKANEKLAYRLKKENSKTGKRSLSQNSSRDLEEADKENELQSFKFENGHTNLQRVNKNLTTSPESSLRTPNLSAHSTENLKDDTRQIPSTSHISTDPHRPSTSGLSSISHLPSTSKLPFILHLRPPRPRSPSPSAYSRDQSISPSSSNDECTSECETPNYSPPGELN